MPGQRRANWDRDVPETLNIDCGYCRRPVLASRISQAVEVGRRDLPAGFGSFVVRVGVAYVCENPECGRPSVVFMELECDQAETRDRGVVGQLPRGQAEPMEDLPDAIQNVRAEAWSCFWGGDYRAALTMGRAAVQRGVRTLGGERRDLYHEIDDLRERGLVTEELRGIAHEVRLAAREAAHPEELGDVTREEAQESLEFMDDFLRFAIAMPARAARRRAEREAEPAE